jgi:hypothetical protein
MVHTCGLGSVHCTALAGICPPVGVAHEASNRNQGKIAILVLVFIIKTPGLSSWPVEILLSCHVSDMPDVLANLIDDSIEFFGVQTRITTGQWNHGLVVQNHQQPV